MKYSTHVTGSMPVLDAEEAKALGCEIEGSSGRFAAMPGSSRPHSGHPTPGFAARAPSKSGTPACYPWCTTI